MLIDLSIKDIKDIKNICRIRDDDGNYRYFTILQQGGVGLPYATIKGKQTYRRLFIQEIPKEFIIGEEYVQKEK